MKERLIRAKSQAYLFWFLWPKLSSFVVANKPTSFMVFFGRTCIYVNTDSSAMLKSHRFLPDAVWGGSLIVWIFHIKPKFCLLFLDKKERYCSWFSIVFYNCFAPKKKKKKKEKRKKKKEKRKKKKEKEKEKGKRSQFVVEIVQKSSGLSFKNPCSRCFYTSCSSSSEELKEPIFYFII